MSEVKIHSSLITHHFFLSTQGATSMTTHRVALGSIFTECNQMGGVPIDLAWFERYELHRGDAILGVKNGVVGGMLQVLAERGATPVPLLYASTCPGGPLTQECYEQLKNELLARLRAVLPVAGVLLPLHGAAAAEQVGDLEGDLIQAIRAIVGPAVPIVATLDLHAHVTAAMVSGADALVAWATYPHRDAFGTGVRGANLLLDALGGRCRPTMVMAKVPVITSAIHGATEGDDPFAKIMRRAKALEGQQGVLSTSVFLVHPNLDQADMGSGALVITDNDPAKATALARDLAEEYWARRFELEPTLYTPAQAIEQGLQIAGGPVILVEAGDCAGGGAAGDSVAYTPSVASHPTNRASLGLCGRS
jgi:microcystin degradation protein MlrC